MPRDKPIINKEHLLQKFPGKGGWTYTVIEGIPQNKKVKFGWVQVSGSIDGFELKQYKLMPMSNGQLFLPVRAEIRKKIKKQAGDIVHVLLYIDNSPTEAPQEFLVCLQEDSKANRFFKQLSDSEKKIYIDWIYDAKKEETKIERMAQTINRLAIGLKRHDIK
jgi:Bacteriocin-protection, YdeI or OmpD-Associated/Domain of unknown function (DUF1905)